MAKSETGIPTHLQPKPEEFGFDLEQALRAIVGLRAHVPEDAATAGTLGTERAGSAVQFRPGLFLTIGYLITEAEAIWLTTADGGAVAGHTLAYNQETGFGIVQALGRLDLPTVRLVDSSGARPGDPVLFAASGGRRSAVSTKIIGRQEFAGYWEYLIEDAIFTTPAHPFWGGGALLDANGHLIGIGSLVLQQGGAGSKRQDMNMVVPTELLLPIYDDLARGEAGQRPGRPWLGVYAQEIHKHVVVVGIAGRGPADRAGLKAGDVIRSAGTMDITNLADFYRSMWALGPAGVDVPLTLEREGDVFDLRVTSADRRSFLKGPRLH